MAFLVRSRLAIALALLAVASVAASPSLAQVATTYTYDTRGQVKTVARPEGTVTYTYDGAGNRSAVTMVYVPPGAAGSPLSVPFGGSASLALPVSGRVTGAAINVAPTKGSVSIVGTTATYTASGANYGVDSFTYHAIGPGGNSAVQTVNVTIGNPPAPVANNFSQTVAYSAATALSLSISGVATGVVIDAAPTKGTVSISGASATYTATWPQYGLDSFSYHATGPGGSSAVRIASLTIANPPAPTAGNSSISTASNTAVTMTYAAYGDYANAVLNSQPVHGSVSTPVVVSGVGAQSTYTPQAGYYGPDSWTFHATSPGGNSAVYTVSVSVNAVAPSASNASLNVGYTSAASLALPVSGMVTGIVIDGAPTKGSVSISGTTATYTAPWPSYGADSFNYHAVGPGGSSPVRTVSVVIANPPPPTAASTSASTFVNTPVAITYPVAGDYATPALNSQPGHGSISAPAFVSGVGYQSVYTPQTGYSGPDSWTFHTTSPGGNSAVYMVSVSVNIPPPGASNAALNVGYAGAASLALPVSGTVSGIVIDSVPAKGSVSISETTATYTATWPSYGADSFTYHATGPGGSSPVRTVSVTIANPPVPFAANGSASANFNTPVTVTYSVSGGGYGVPVLDSQPAHGSVTTPTNVSGAGYQSIYTPQAGFSGTDSWIFHATSPGGTSAAATFTVTVAGPLNRPPVANADHYEVEKGTTDNYLDVLSNDTDPDGNALTITSVTNVGGSVSIAPGGGYLIFNAPGNVGISTLQYTISDGHGGSASASAQVVSIRIFPSK